ncbi:MAG: S10 family peptidase [Vulcanimicrobiaceae bacterium]
MKRCFALALASGFFLSASAAIAAGAPAHTHAATIPAATPDAVSQHSVEIGGKSYAYTARAGTITLRNTQHQPTLRMFYVAYTLDGASPTHRPVTFFYNGGPGSSTMWLHMGSFGPVRVNVGDGTITNPPPYSVSANPYSLLDKTDLVFIDMPGSGFGRIIGKGTPKMFWGVDGDIAAFGQFIERYITNFHRWNSPKFLFGESYGTTRSAGLVDYLQNHGIGMNGVVLQSSILNFNLDWSTNFGATDIGGGDWSYVLYLPTAAATAWYHHAIPNRPASLPAFLAQVQRFAMGPYLSGLAQGANLPRSQFDALVSQLHAYTGLSEQYIRNANLRIQYGRFENELLRNDGKTVGRLDSRFETGVLDRNATQPSWDTTDAAIDAPYTTAINAYLRDDLHYTSPLRYRSSVYSLIGKSGGWNWKHGGIQPTNVAPDLAEAMTYNPHLRVFSANGYYDFATPYFATVYTLTHLYLSPAIQSHITYGFYQSGHMIYLRPKSLAHYKADLARWYDSTLSGQ